MRTRFLAFIAVFSAILGLAHWFLYAAWVRAFGPTPFLLPLTIFLAGSFVVASILAFRYSAWPVQVYYRLAAGWIGIANYLLPAAVVAWIFPHAAVWCFCVGAAVGVYGMVNAAATRVRRVEVALPGLPASWRGQTLGLISDLHLGHVRGVGFVRRMVATLRRHEPKAVVIAGDLFDGTAAVLPPLCAPWRELGCPAYFSAGNHEGFGGREKYLEAVAATGVRVLGGECVDVDGLQLAGVHYREAADAVGLRTILQSMGLDRERASVLINHAPDNAVVAAECGISLQLSGHTHGGQFFPYTLIVRRIYGRLAHGLSRVGNMQAFVTYGAGTWGPPLRVGTSPEIVLLRLV